MKYLGILIFFVFTSMLVDISFKKKNRWYGYAACILAFVYGMYI